MSAAVAFALACAPQRMGNDREDDAREHASDSAEIDAAVSSTSIARSNVGSDNAFAASMPRFFAGDAPLYPKMSRRLGEEGWVELAFDVSQDGEVIAIEVLSAQASQRLREAALTAAKTWRFAPRTGPRGVDRLTHRIVFALDDVR